MKKDLMSIEDALGLSQAEIRQLYKDHVNPGLASMLSLLNLIESLSGQREPKSGMQMVTNT